MHIIGYARISKEDLEINPNALENQIKRLERFGCTEIFEDIQKGSDDDRPSFMALMQRVKDRDKCDRVVITRDDRITRSINTTLEILSIFDQSGCELVILEEGKHPIDLNNPYEWKRRVTAGLDAQFEIKMLSTRVKRGFEEFRNQSKAPAKVPFGYKRIKEKYVKDSESSEIVSKYFQFFFEERSIGKAVNRIKTELGINVYRSTLARMLVNPVYYGHTAYGIRSDKDFKEIKYNTHLEERYLEDEKLEMIQEILRENKKHRGRNQPYKHYPLGSGLCICNHCLSPMAIGKYHNGLWLRCIRKHESGRKKCELSHIVNVSKLEDYLIEKLCEKASEIANKIIENDVKEVYENPKILELKRSLNSLVGDHPAIVAARDQIEKEILDLIRNDNVEDYKTTLNRELLIEIGNDFNFWKTLPDVEKKKYYRLFVKNIYIYLPDAEKKINRSVKFEEYQITIDFKI